METENNKIDNEVLAAIVKATQNNSYLFTPQSVHVPLMAANLVEINTDLVNETCVATRATPEGIKISILWQWEQAKATLVVAKEEEMRLRLEVVKLYSDAEKHKGTENIVLEDDSKLKIVKKQNFKLDPDLDKVETALDKIEAMGPEFEIIASRLVKWSADISVSEYNKLDETKGGEKIKQIIDEVLTITDATPSVDLVEPKAKK